MFNYNIVQFWTIEVLVC